MVGFAIFITHSYLSPPPFTHLSPPNSSSTINALRPGPQHQCHSTIDQPCIRAQELSRHPVGTQELDTFQDVYTTESLLGEANR